MQITDTTVEGRGVTADGERLLRKALQVNAVSSASTGLFALVFAGLTSELIGVDQRWLIRLVGAGLVAFAISVVAASRADRTKLAPASLVISLNDFGWVVLTAVVAVVGWLSDRGVVIMGAIAVMVLGFGLVQLFASRRMTTTV